MAKTKLKTGAQMVVDVLVDEGVDILWGLTGGAILPVFDALYQNSHRIRLIDTRHEQGAIHMAEGYAKGGSLRRHFRPRSHQHRHGFDRRLYGLGSPGRDYGTGSIPFDRNRRLPGSGRGRHHALLHETQFPGEKYPGTTPSHEGRL